MIVIVRSGHWSDDASEMAVAIPTRSYAVGSLDMTIKRRK